MRCKICDSVMNKPTWNKDLNDWEVCGDCLEVIFNVFEDAPERYQEVEEDETPEEVELSKLDAEASIWVSEAIEKARE
jgi:23S rRNA C2498 (ribose-2'-O)-methylase RlmM